MPSISIEIIEITENIQRENPILLDELGQEIEIFCVAINEAYGQ